jgi:hypothetical protein
VALIDVLRAGEELVKDEELGLNAEIARVNADKEAEAPPFQTIEAMKSPMPTKIQAFPAFLQLPVPGGVLDLMQQKKRQHEWRIEWHALWRWTEQDYELVAATIEAMGRVLERLECRGTIAQILDASLDVTGFVGQQRQFTIVHLGFRVKEREEFE